MDTLMPIYSSQTFDFNDMGYNPPAQSQKKGREIFSDLSVDGARAGLICSGALAATLFGRLIPTLGLGSILLRLVAAAYCCDQPELTWVDAVAVVVGSICGDWDIVLPILQILSEFISAATVPLSIGAIAIFALFLAVKYAN
ncbi:hypothetical protein QUB29_26460 [Microcoleus sp. B4b_D2]|uniref:hypothetical protein n=1 Tax=Microcoleus sp. B4b_D2 TaxID=3055310 RepID=UPI002FCFA5B3